jgi:hypothetical protein
MKIPRWLLRVGQLILIVAVTYGIVRALAPEVAKVSTRDFAAWRPAILPVLAATIMLLAVYLAHCLLWRVITTKLGGVKPGLKSALRMYFVAGLARYIPGKLWQIAGLAVLAQRAGVSVLAATAALIAAQFAFLTSGLLYLSLLLPGFGGYAPIIGALVSLAIGGGAFFAFTATRVGHDARAWLTTRFGQRFGNALMLIDRITWREATVWWLAYALTWALLGAAFVVFVRAFAPVEPAHYLQVAGTVAAAYLFGYVAFFSLAGLGIREAVMLGLLNQVMPAPAALVVSVASRLWFTAAELLPLAIIPFVRDEQA